MADLHSATPGERGDVDFMEAKDSDDIDRAMDDVVLLESKFVKEGYREGLQAGEERGRAEGVRSGYRAGLGIGRELGFYRGFAAAHRAGADLRDKVVRALDALDAALERFRPEEPEADSFDEDYERVRAQYKMVCALLGIRCETFHAPNRFSF